MASANSCSPPNPRDETSCTVFLDGLCRYAAKEIVRFHTPGHRGGRWLPKSMSAAIGSLVGPLDVSDVLEGAGSVTSWVEAIEVAQQKTAELFGASASRFLVNGTSGGIHAAVMSLAPGGTALCNRAAHLSVYAAGILGRCTIHNVLPDYDPEWDIPGPPSPLAILNALGEVRPDLFIETYPNYYGIAPRLDLVVEGVPGTAVLADEAHGSHFLYCEGAPETALECGAHVSIQSFHKTLGALTQASVLHVARGHEDLLPRIDRSLFLLQTTSASPILLGSLEAATQQAGHSAKEDWRRAEELTTYLRQRVNRNVGCRVLHVDDVVTRWGATMDPTRAVIRVADIGWSGLDAAESLRVDYDIQVEMANQHCIILLISPGNEEWEIDQVVAALQGLKERGSGGEPAVVLDAPPLPRRAMPPWDAVDAGIASVPLGKSKGRISAEMVCPYPPGIPVILPGEEITPDVVDYLARVRDLGVEVRGAARADLSEISVVR